MISTSRTRSDQACLKDNACYRKNITEAQLHVLSTSKITETLKQVKELSTLTHRTG